jgi:tRNA nucleotidyltransferase/poly(A) polymerase
LKTKRASPDDDFAYAGRWIARVRGKIVAQGGTPDQARLAAKTSRPKETPEIVFMPPVEPLTFSPLVEAVQKTLPVDQPMHLVGGSVRDALLKRETHDLDFAVPKNGLEVARRLANALDAAYFPLDAARETGRIVVQNPDGVRDVLDVATYRGLDLEADLAARDFTINALAYDLHTRSLFDPLNGALDLREKRIRACGPTTFSDDPVRILRAVRQAAVLGFSIQPETRQTMKKCAPLLMNVSPERRRDELFRILDGPHPATAIRALDILGVTPYLLPELTALKGVEQSAPHVHDVWTHTLKSMDCLETILAVLSPGYNPNEASDLFSGLTVLQLGRYRQKLAEHLLTPPNVERSLRALLFFAVLYHDIAKPSARAVERGRIRFLGHDEQGAEMIEKRARAFNLSNDEVERLKLIVRQHMRVHYHVDRLIRENKQPTRRGIYRFFRDTGETGVDLILIAMADLRATQGHTMPQETWSACLEVCRILLENLWDKPQETVSPPVLVNGEDVMSELGLEPGPLVGEVLEAVREAQSMGVISTRDEAINFGHEFLRKK